MSSTAAMRSIRFPAVPRNSLPPEPVFPRWRRKVDVAVPSTAWRENAILKSSPQEYNSKSIEKKLKEVELDTKIPEPGKESVPELSERGREIWKMIEEVKAMLSSMGDGEITSSAYDTAWVAMVPDLIGGGGPQFPSSLQWIIDNQLEDGSWGNQVLFSAYDRIISTLACAVALRFWSVCLDQCQKGLLFLKENMWRLAEENEELMPIAFEVALPSLIDLAKGLGLDCPYDHPALQYVYAKREIKLERIPRELMHKVPTTLLHSLEGMPGLEWQSLLRLQSSDGSFLFSPSSTAYAFMQTGNENCLSYLKKVVERFHGGVPNVYPVDIFEHLWVVDRLQRLGISRYFEAEIRQCMEYVFKYWSEHGMCWARNSEVRDIDDTAMGFRLLRLHGYSVSPDVFRNFKRDDKFFGFIGQSTQAVTGMYNLNRASQLIFSGEEILNQAKNFSYQFLREKQASNLLLDKWVISKDLPGEVAYALDFPFYASLPRVESRWYIEQYGGDDDVWIGKSLYRMLYVNNAVYLELAKADFNQCQAIHKLEWLSLQRWFEACVRKEYGMRQKNVLRAYFLASASKFEPDRSAERLCWAGTAALAQAVVVSYNDSSATNKVEHCSTRPDPDHQCRSKQTAEELVGHILMLLDRPLLLRVPAQTFRHHLRRAWEEWLVKLEEGESRGETALLLVRSIELCAGRTEPEGGAARLEYDKLVRLTISICGRLPVHEGNKIRIADDSHLESDMQQLIKCVLQPESPDGLSGPTKQTFLAVIKSIYYLAWCPPAALDDHITKVLFERVG
ncbi:ent-copalyl diphosphate synthase 1, chloroplastic [Phalaenopsis equestris]|uniref:ent-copalyl diphosphate synthase 1, chloroplastic n=1 Tax=Phalaenopsis equestris TaxID=78828 RepID=UPI0009E42052|nr:ent-copalyl diphosphate synthase 1, chloroplastic [Phalaenopsis equestris]